MNDFERKSSFIQFDDDLNQKIRQFALALTELELSYQDRVIVRFWNEIDFIITYFALLQINCIPVTVSPLLTKSELENIYLHSGAKLIISFDNLENLAKQFTIQQICPDLHSPNKSSERSNRFIEESSKERTSFKKQANHKIPTDLRAIIYTSGTTGSPKGVMLTQSNIKSQVASASRVLKLTPNDSFLGILSLSHVFGQMDVMWAAKEVGCRIHLLKHFNVREALTMLRDNNITVLIAVPTMYQLMVRYLEKNPMSFPKLRVCHSGAAPMSETLFSEIEKHFGAPVQEGYGLTETCSMAFSNPLDGLRKPSSVGKPINGVTYKLIDEKGNKINSANEVGEVCIKGPIVTPGYLFEESLTKRAFDEENYLLTGDLGYFDEEGYLFLVDRKKDLIIRSGFKVYPREVEEILQKHPGVLQAVVMGIDNELQNQKIKAFIVPKNQLVSDEDLKGLINELRSFCIEHLAKYKQPNYYEIVDNIPQTPSGKPLRRFLKS
ncbi:MAG: AMP-binding protein [Candidatus Caenarcaniphilales bacterium]|nr:AMP-binding protein [Candidatus Caenarcaniphilales bacterium]